MGYTHYFRHGETSKEKWNLIVKDCKALKEALPDSIEIAGWNGTGEPTFNKSKICFNGHAPKDYETFNMQQIPEHQSWEEPNKRPFAFCKTAYRPYDLLVCACLLVYKHHSPLTMELGSDGGNAEWVDAEGFVKDILGYDLSFSHLNE
jgi:hypothetical protein